MKKKTSLSSILTSSTASVVISLSLVLFVIGLLALFIVNSKQIINEYKEDFVFTIMLADDIPEIESSKIRKELKNAKYTKEVIYVSQKDAAKKLSKDLGEDFEEFLGYIPLPSSIDLKIKAEFANKKSLEKINKQILANNYVFETFYQKDKVDKMNKFTSDFSLIFLALSGVLFFIAFALINNTIRLSVYSKRFLIRTMRLVGATNRFIQTPFLKKGIYYGMLAALFSIFLLTITIKIAFDSFGIEYNINDLKIIGFVYLFVFISGILLSLFSTFFAVKKYINIKENRIYN